MDYENITKIYNGYAHLYDFLFSAFFHPRQKAAIADLELPPGSKVLDVGVGTGLTLPLYPNHCEVTGIDISTDMLRQAKKKVDKLKLTHVELMEMDACDIEFNDNTFDYVIATHIITVVPEPFKVIDEMKRVAKPDGKLVIVNHFTSSNPVIARMENFCDPLFRKVGWRTDMSYEEMVETSNLEVYKTDQVTRMDLWKIVHANNNNKVTATNV